MFTISDLSEICFIKFKMLLLKVNKVVGLKQNLNCGEQTLPNIVLVLYNIQGLTKIITSENLTTVEECVLSASLEKKLVKHHL